MGYAKAGRKINQKEEVGEKCDIKTIRTGFASGGRLYNLNKLNCAQMAQISPDALCNFIFQLQPAAEWALSID
jgi:hypothetical protein